MAFNFGIEWIVVAIIIIAIIVVVALVKKRQAMATGVVTIFSIFIVISLGYVFITHNIQLNSIGSLVDGTKIYLNWMWSFFDKAYDVTSYAIKMDWASNSTVVK